MKTQDGIGDTGEYCFRAPALVFVCVDGRVALLLGDVDHGLAENGPGLADRLLQKGRNNERRRTEAHTLPSLTAGIRLRVLS